MYSHMTPFLSVYTQANYIKNEPCQVSARMKTTESRLSSKRPIANQIVILFNDITTVY